MAEEYVNPLEAAMLAQVQENKEDPTPVVEDEPKVEPDPTIVEDTSTEEPVIETPIEEEPVVNEPDASTEDDSTPPVETTTVVTEDETIDLDDWDAEPDIEPTPSEEPTAKSTLIELGFDGLSVTEAKEKIASLQEATKVDPLAELPDNLKKAVQIAKDNGDYLQYLGVTAVDYNAIADSVLFENDVARYFVDEQGTFDKDGFEEYMDTLSDKDVEIKGKQLKRELIAKQAAQTERLEAEASQRQMQAEKDLKAVLDRTDEIQGFKLKPSHKKVMFDTITSGDLMRELFYDKAGNMDWNKVTKAYFNHKWGDKAVDFIRQRMETAAKKRLLQDLGNAQVNTPPPAQVDAVPKGPDTPEEIMAKHLAGGGFQQ